MEQLYAGGVRKFNECESSKVRQMKCNFVVSPATNEELIVEKVVLIAM